MTGGSSLAENSGKTISGSGSEETVICNERPKSLGMFRKGGVSKLGKWEMSWTDWVGGQVMLDPPQL